MLYPIHQTYGQLCSSIMLATENTKMLRNINTVFVIIGLLLSFFLMAPEVNYGLNLAARGYAIKMVTVQFIQVNVLIWYSMFLLKLSYTKIFFNQFFIIGLTFLIAFITKFILSQLLIQTSILFNLIIHGFVYIIFTFSVLYLFPSIIFTTRSFINSQIIFIYNKVFNNNGADL